MIPEPQIIPDPQTYQLDEDLHLRLWRMTYRGTLPGAFLRFFGVIALALIVLAVFFQPDWLSLLVGVGSGCVFLFLILCVQYWVLVPRQSGKVFRESVKLHEPQTLRVDEAGFEVTQPSAHANYGWGEIAKWDETGDFFGIFPNRAVAYIVPKAQVDPALLDYARAKLIENGLPKPGKLRK